MDNYSCHSGALCSGPSLHHIPDGKLQIGTQANPYLVRLRCFQHESNQNPYLSFFSKFWWPWPICSDIASYHGWYNSHSTFKWLFYLASVIPAGYIDWHTHSINEISVMTQTQNRNQVLVVGKNVQCKGPLLCWGEECGLGNYEGVQHGLIIRLAGRDFRDATLAENLFCVNIGFKPT